MKKPGRREVLNAFQPAKEIDDPLRFAGRSVQFGRALEALLTEGAHLCIYGQRGIGKSSFARQVGHVASGSRTVLEQLSLESFGRDGFDFVVRRIACDDSVLTLDHLLRRAMTSADGLSAWVPDEILKRVEQDSRDFGIAPSGIGAKSHHNEATETRPMQLHLIEHFLSTVEALQRSEKARDGALLIIDEFDRVGDRSGLASLLKAMSGTKFKVMLVGVADDLRSLVTEHESLQRQLSEGAILVPPMQPDELLDIIAKAEASLDDSILLHLNVKRRIAELSRGQPYLVHLFGKYALLDAYNDGQDLVELPHLESALSRIAVENQEASLADRYRTAVAGSRPRESVLRAFASINRDHIHNSKAYELCPDVEQPAVYLGHLRQNKYGAELIDRGNRYHEFRDALFKAYVNAIPRTF